MNWTGVRQRWQRIPRLTWAPQHHDRQPIATYYLIVVPALILAAFGLLMAFSASAVTNIDKNDNPYREFLKPGGIIVVSVLVAALVVKVPEAVIRRLAGLMFAFSLILQLLVLTPLGMTVGGNRNWINVPGLGMSLQPSEFLKLTLALFLAVVVTRPGARRNDWKQMLFTAGGVSALAVGFVMLGSDLGTALVMLCCAIGVLWVAGLPGKWFLIALCAGVPVLGFLIAQNPTRLKRITDVLPWNQTAPSVSAPTQVDHALWAFGSGGIIGLGPGASREKWNYLQAANTDFVLAIIGEEFGLLGTLTVLICLALLVWGMVRVSLDHSSAFVRACSGGVAAWIASQATINVMSATGVGPVIGVPLPLVSYGGSSFLFTACAVAVMGSFARDAAGMKMWRKPDEASAGLDPRRQPTRRSTGARTQIWKVH